MKIMAEMSLENKIKRLKHIQQHTSNWTDDKIVGEAIRSLEENSNLHKQLNMWQSEHAKRVLELGKLREKIKLAREELEELATEQIKIYDEENPYISSTVEYVSLTEVRELLDELIGESEGK